MKKKHTLQSLQIISFTTHAPRELKGGTNHLKESKTGACCESFMVCETQIA